MPVPIVRPGRRSVGRVDSHRDRSLLLAVVLWALLVSGVPPARAAGAPPRSGGSTARLSIAPDGFVLIGCTVFDAAQQAALFGPFEGRPLETADLLDLVDAVRGRYADAGYATAEVELPDQDLEGGQVRIEVHEGRLEDIEITGAIAYQPSYFRARLDRAAGDPIHLPSLYLELERLQADPAILKIAAVLERVGPGRQRLHVEVRERSPWSASARFSNHRSPSVGSPGGIFSVGHSSLIGFGDRLSVLGQVSEGVRDFGLYWDVPLVVTDTRVFVAYRRGTADIVEREFQDQGIGGRFESITLGLRHPVYWTPSLEAWLELAGDRRSGASTIFGTDYCFQDNLRDCEPTVSVLRMSQELVHRGRTRAAAARSTLSLGLDVLGATSEVAARDRDGEFVSWLLQLQWVERMPNVAPLPLFDGTHLAGRFDLQVANDPLVAVEQFAVGGGRSVRGYRENQLVRDNGLVASAELRVPVVRSSFDRPVVTIAPFVDLGRAWDRRLPSSSDKSIVSTGFALGLALTESLRAELSWAHRFRDLEPKASGLQGEGIYFEVVWDVF